MSRDLTSRSIEDFGAQWTRYQSNTGFYASLELFRDICGPLLTPEDIRATRVAEIGAGTGRIVGMLLQAGAAHVVALEPSAAIEVLRRNTEDVADRVECLHLTGEELPERNFDLVVSIGVLHHIPNPDPVVATAFRALRPDGRIVIWVYGREGNESYLRIVQPLRAVTTRLPVALLAGLSWVLTATLGVYMVAARVLPLPLRAYLARVIAPLSWRERQLVVFDQLKPAVAKYYRGDEASALLTEAGFVDVRRYHRHGYSWTITGRRPAAPADRSARVR